MTKALSLLYVDDDPDIRMVVKMALGLDAAISVRTAASGAEALRIVVEGGWRPDLIVLDVVMPDMNGLELLEILRRHAPLQHVPAVFMTANGREADMENYKRMNVKGIIVKPFDPLRLSADIRALLG